MSGTVGPPQDWNLVIILDLAQFLNGYPLWLIAMLCSRSVTFWTHYQHLTTPIISITNITTIIPTTPIILLPPSHPPTTLIIPTITTTPILPAITTTPILPAITTTHLPYQHQHHLYMCDPTTTTHVPAMLPLPLSKPHHHHNCKKDWRLLFSCRNCARCTDFCCTAVWSRKTTVCC